MIPVSHSSKTRYTKFGLFSRQSKQMIPTNLYGFELYSYVFLSPDGLEDFPRLLVVTLADQVVGRLDDEGDAGEVEERGGRGDENQSSVADVGSEAVLQEEPQVGEDLRDGE